MRSGELVASAVVAVLVVGLVLAVVGSRGDGSGGPAAGSLDNVIGYRWRVVHIVDSQGALSVPGSLHAEIGFTRDGHVSGDDTVNALSGNCEATADGYIVHHVTSSAVGYVGGDPVHDRAVAAVDAMFTDVSEQGSLDVVRVGVSVAGDTLILTRGEFTVTLQHAGTEANPTFLPSSTNTPTS